jgi:hypothetical protein
MRKRRPPMAVEDTGWQPEGEHPLCTAAHQARLIVAMDFADGYRNVYACRNCQATRILSGPHADGVPHP